MAERKEIDGQILKSMLLGGLRNLKRNVETVNNLNVFPIPDGDTGDNMYYTLSEAIRPIRDCEEHHLGFVAKQIGEGVILGARGNSGVILSQMIAGIADEFSKHERADMDVTAKAFENAVKRAYASVSEPVEGTMLTVLREATNFAVSRMDDKGTLESFLRDYISETERSLERTPDLLPVLKEAGVVDSGGAGILHIMKGFLNALEGETEESEPLSERTGNKQIDLSLFNENSVMQYGYCTEFLLQLTRAKTDIPSFSLEDMRKKLSTFGDSIVAVKTGTIVKVHVHTLTPGAVLSYAQAFGEFLTVKIENMTLQHNEVLEKKEQPAFKKNLTRKPFGLVAVADGEGLISAFKELGADIVIDGGQGNNPPVELFIAAFDALNRDTIFVLPDNNNVMMAAREAAKLYQQSDVRVIEANDIGDGYAVLTSLDYDSGDADTIESNMNSDMRASRCVMVSRAVRPSEAGGLKISEGDYIGFHGKDILVTEKDKTAAALALLTKVGAEQNDFIVVFCGAEVSESERGLLKERMTTAYPNSEIYMMDGGQAIYDYIIVLQ